VKVVEAGKACYETQWSGLYYHQIDFHLLILRSVKETSGADLGQMKSGMGSKTMRIYEKRRDERHDLNLNLRLRCHEVA